MPSTNWHIVFSGGGTGGHLFPGLVVAGQLRRRLPEVRITFAGGGTPFEREHVTRAGFDHLVVASQPLPRKPWHALRFVTKHMAGYRSAARYLREHHVALVVGLGGHSSVPMARAARARRLPLVLLEQNVVMGRANRWLAPSAALVCGAFPPLRQQLRPSTPVEITGNPVRLPRARRGQTAESERSPHRPRRLLVLGGSQGASLLNEQVPRALYKVGQKLHGWEVVHQTGQRELASTRELYRKLAVPARVEPFLENVGAVLAATDLVISRAGGTTLAELAVHALPAVLVPYPHAADDHQRKNAEFFAAAGGCALVDPRMITGRVDNHLANLLGELLDNGPQRQAMSLVMRRLARPDAARTVARLICELLQTGALRKAS